MVAQPDHPVELLSGYATVAVRLPIGLLAELQAQLGDRSLSRKLAEIIEEHLRLAALNDFLPWREREFGPQPERRPPGLT